MMPNIITDPKQTFDDLSLIHETSLAHVDYLSIYALNYIYVDFKTETMVISGTESAWIQHMIEKNLHQDLAHRLKEFAHEWSTDSQASDAYKNFMLEQAPDRDWMKTDYCLKGQHGMHLLEIGHTQELGIDAINQFNDLVNSFKHETLRLRDKYPKMMFQIQNMQQILDQQEVFAQAEQAMADTMKIEFDMRLFEPLPEPVLTAKEDQALSLRVQWFEDDEIADQMECSLKEIKGLFTSIKDKYHQPKIPQRVYLAKRKQIFSELFA